jgi:hypothetical protein
MYGTGFYTFNKGFYMNITIFNKSNRRFIKSSVAVFLIFQFIPLVIWAKDNEQDIFNQFYKEIITSATNGKTGKFDSINLLKPSSACDQKVVPPAGSNVDAVSERVKKEIDKNINDFQLRHSDAVKFMQNEK